MGCILCCPFRVLHPSPNTISLQVRERTCFRHDSGLYSDVVIVNKHMKDGMEDCGREGRYSERTQYHLQTSSDNVFLKFLDGLLIVCSWFFGYPDLRTSCPICCSR